MKNLHPTARRLSRRFFWINPEKLILLDAFKEIRAILMDAFEEIYPTFVKATAELDLTPATPLEEECTRATRAYFDQHRNDPTFFRNTIEG